MQRIVGRVISLTQAGDIAATEAFVVNELRKQAGWSELAPTLYHYRASAAGKRSTS